MIVSTYTQVRTASGQDDFVRLQIPSLGGQRAIDQRAALQEAVEHRDQGPLVVVPSQAKLLADGHVAAFARRLLSRGRTANIAFANSAVETPTKLQNSTPERVYTARAYF